jgi:hypothetical protein
MSSAQQGFPPSSSLTSNNIKIDILPVLANSQASYVLQNNLNQLSIKTRSLTKLKYSFIPGNIALGEYWTIPRGCEEVLSDLNFSGKIIYIQADIACDVEFKEIYS